MEVICSQDYMRADRNILILINISLKVVGYEAL